MKSKEAIIAKAADDMFEVTELEGVIEFDKETARVFMRRVWKIAYKRGRKKGMKDEQDILIDEANKTRRDFERAQ